ADVSKILLYHTLGAKVLAAQVPAGPNAAVATAGGDSIFLTSNANGVFVNGIKVTQADVAATNGVIHVIGSVLMPPAGNIVEIAQADTTFSLLVAAVLRASQGSTNVAQVLTGAGPFTVFAPTNNAFRAAGFPDAASIQAAEPDVLTSILTYHVIGARVFSSDLSDGLQPTTVNGGKVTIGLTAGATVKGNANTTASNIIATNIVATNGVIHVIDQVLLP
ncbi:MAG: fasciclin domain-containing protein, partial [Ginsengibacter sp.]